MKTASTDKIYEQIGQRIVDARKAKGWSQERLATESHLDRSHMGFIEQGSSKADHFYLGENCEFARHKP